MGALHFRFYDSLKSAAQPGPTVFLAGPTTDEKASGRSWYEGRELSVWRAAFAKRLEDLGVKDVVLVVPEFQVKGAEAGGWFRAKADEHFGGGPGVLAWEEEQMRAADIVVAWLDVRREPPYLGLNARPEIYGLMMRSRGVHGTWTPRRLVLGIEPSAQAVSRFRLLAKELEIPVKDSLEALAHATWLRLIDVKPVPDRLPLRPLTRQIVLTVALEYDEEHCTGCQLSTVAGVKSPFWCAGFKQYLRHDQQGYALRLPECRAAQLSLGSGDSDNDAFLVKTPPYTNNGFVVGPSTSLSGGTVLNSANSKGGSGDSNGGSGVVEIVKKS